MSYHMLIFYTTKLKKEKEKRKIYKNRCCHFYIRNMNILNLECTLLYLIKVEDHNLNIHFHFLQNILNIQDHNLNLFMFERRSKKEKKVLWH